MNELAVSPSNPNPGFYMRVDLLASQSSPGADALRGLVISPPQSGQGDITVGTEIRTVFSREDVEAAIGRGPGYYAYQAILANDPECLVDIVACAESGGDAAVGTLTFAGSVTASETWRLTIMGWDIDLDRAAGESADDAKTAAIARINARGADVMVVASSGGTGIVALTANTKGPIGNDIKLRIKRLAGVGGTAVLGAAALAGGTTEHNATTALETVEGREYDFILVCTSNAEAQHASSGNPFRVRDHIGELETGLNAKLQQGVYGSTGTFAAAKTNTGGMNSEVMQHICGKNFEMLPCELAAAEMGDRMRRRRRDPNPNRVLTRLKRVRAAADPVVDNPTEPELGDATNTGVTCMRYDANNLPILSRPITTRHKDGNANPDYRCRDTNEVCAVYSWCKDLRTFIPQQFLDSEDDGQVKIAKDRTTGDEETPRGVVEERDITAVIVQRTLDFWVPAGVINRTVFEAAVASGEVRTRVNPSDETQADIVLSGRPYKILAKLGLLVKKA